MKITYDMLADVDACDDQLELFRERFGNEVEITRDTDPALAAGFNVTWAASHLFPGPQWDDYWTKFILLRDECEGKVKVLLDDYEVKRAPFMAERDANRRVLMDYIAKCDLCCTDFNAKCGQLFIKIAAAIP